MGVVSIFTDGAARGNPDGPGGYGTILQYTDKEGTLHEKELSQGYLRTTNNRMELMAAIAGLEALNSRTGSKTGSGMTGSVGKAARSRTSISGNGSCPPWNPIRSALSG